MKPVATKLAPLVLPTREEWDFDLDGCPEDELEHCCFYEYALALPSVKKAVALWRRKLRRNPKEFEQEGDDLANMVRDRWFGSPFRLLVDHPEFPHKHWLQIDPDSRKQRVKQLPPYSTIAFPNNPPRYEGPQPAHFNQLKAEMLRWQDIKQETETLLVRFQEAEAKGSLRAFPTQLREYLSVQEISDWQKRYSQLSGDKLHRAARKLLAQCKKTIQRRHREVFELVAYEIDWTLRPKELKERFGKWAEANRAHEPRSRSGGHPTKALELLKALGAKRLLDFFRKNQKNLPRPYKNQTLHDGLHDFTVDQRKTANRQADPLFKTRKGWNDAEKLALGCLK